VTVCFFYTTSLGNQTAADEMNTGAYREKVIEWWTWLHQPFCSHSLAAIQGVASPALETCLTPLPSLVYTQPFALADELWN